jgi:hypothetical protein
MSYKETYKNMRVKSRRLMHLVQAAVLVTAGILPLLAPTHVGAAQITARSATITNPNPGSSQIQVAFAYTLPTVGQNQQGITYQFCTQALGTCTLPTDLDARTSTTSVSQGGWPTNATNFVPRNISSTTNGCLQATVAFACYTRTQATTGGGAVTHTIGGLVEPSGIGTVYIRITTYSDTAYATAQDSGNVAISFNNRFTVNAQVQEVLTACVGNTTIDNATASIVSDCTAATGTSINLGNITNTAISINPVAAGNGGDGNNAYFMVQTNAQSGVAVGYRAVQDTSSGKLKVIGASCSGVTTTDQCFNSQGNTQAAFVAGTENFGMTVAGTNCASATASYTCVYASGSQHLKAVSGYQGQGTFGSSWTYGTSNGFAFDDTGATTQALASSTGAVANEALVLKYAATAQATTPTGVYQAQQDFIATPTF